MPDELPEPSKWDLPDSPELQKFYKEMYAKIRAELTQEDLENMLRMDEPGVPFEDVIAEMERIHEDFERRKRDAG